MGNLPAYKGALRGASFMRPKEIWIAPFTITWKDEFRVFRNKVEITLPFSTSNKLLTILHYGAPLVLALLATIVARPPRHSQLKCLIYTFLHGEFEGFFPAAKREILLKALLLYGSENRRRSFFSRWPGRDSHSLDGDTSEDEQEVDAAAGVKVS